MSKHTLRRCRMNYPCHKQKPQNKDICCHDCGKYATCLLAKKCLNHPDICHQSFIKDVKKCT